MLLKTVRHWNEPELRNLASAKVRGIRTAHRASSRGLDAQIEFHASFALSLLDRDPVGADGSPSVHEVMLDHDHEL